VLFSEKKPPKHNPNPSFCDQYVEKNEFGCIQAHKFGLFIIVLMYDVVIY